MAKSRFVVLRMKDIIRTGIFVIIGIILLVALIWAIMPRGGSGDAMQSVYGNFVPGEYTAYIILHNRPVSVTVTVDENNILDIALSEMETALEVFYPLMRPTMAAISQRVIEIQSTAIEPGIEVMHTSRILLDAIDLALYQATVASEH